jgi:hypothetical protein
MSHSAAAKLGAITFVGLAGRQRSAKHYSKRSQKNYTGNIFYFLYHIITTRADKNNFSNGGQASGLA